MISFDECAAMLDKIADAMPYALYRELNGGISIVPDIKYHPVARNHDLCILGEYKRDLIGNSIVFYYGSIARVYGNLPRAAFYKKLEHILHHEVRHHNEYLAGTDDLGLWDDEQIMKYLQQNRGLGAAVFCVQEPIAILH